MITIALITMMRWHKHHTRYGPPTWQPLFLDPRCFVLSRTMAGPLTTSPNRQFLVGGPGAGCPFSALCTWNRCVLSCSCCGSSFTIWLDNEVQDFISGTSLSSWQLANIPTGVEGGEKTWLPSRHNTDDNNSRFYIIVTSLLAFPPSHASR